MKIRVINKSKHNLPDYSMSISAGMDIGENIERKILLKPRERVLVRFRKVMKHEFARWL